ncbi:oligoendopeptidase F [Pseudogracilibacillus sp. SE30717A]|uniref:oligoendopeptidase F n=1 Tax=Pseudogracilibacillus sp. SE30717A TaxID=3098293 RepID=UPI00300E054F
MRQERKEVPVEQTWNLEDLFESPENWENELQSILQDVDKIVAYKGKLGESSATLLAALKELETFEERLIQVGTYAFLRISVDGANPETQAGAAKNAAAMATINAKLSFFESELLTVPASTIEQYIEKEKELLPYKKKLSDILEKKPYTLHPETEETLAALGEVHEAPFMIYERSKASDMEFDSITDNQGNVLPMSEALYEDRYEISADTTLRRNAYDSYVSTLNKYKNTFAATYATEVTKQVKMAEIRGFDSVIDMLLHPQQVTKVMYENQLKVIQKELAPHMHKYAQLLKKDYGLDRVRFADLKAPLDPEFNPETTYEEAKEMILEALKVLGPEYNEAMRGAFENRWIDYADNVGKQSGAFCASPYGAHPYILLTWTDKMRGAFTLAHELGHAGHFYLANKYQNLVNTDPSTYFVEAPSTMNELLLAEYLMQKTEDKRMKRWVINQLLGTYYHNFITHLLEAEFQNRVYSLAESGVPLTADVLCDQKQATIKSFWGDAADIDEGAGLLWMRQPHYYMGLYPYTYSAGLTVSTIVSQKIKAEGQPIVERWLEVLKAGGTLRPLDLIKEAGVDMSRPDSIKEAVAYVGSLIDELEKSYE